jgi:hypothetical protein
MKEMSVRLVLFYPFVWGTGRVTVPTKRCHAASQLCALMLECSLGNRSGRHGSGVNLANRPQGVINAATYFLAAQALPAPASSIDTVAYIYAARRV